MNDFTKVLETAKRKLDTTGRNRFICGHLWTLAKRYPHACDVLEAHVNREINNRISLHTWLEHALGRDVTAEEAYLCRMAWLDKMIEQFGDDNVQAL